jgi:site-specific DNA-adenine methylase
MTYKESTKSIEQKMLNLSGNKCEDFGIISKLFYENFENSKRGSSATEPFCGKSSVEIDNDFEIKFKGWSSMIARCPIFI